MLLKQTLYKVEKELENIKICNKISFAEVPIMIDKEVQEDDDLQLTSKGCERTVSKQSLLTHEDIAMLTTNKNKLKKDRIEIEVMKNNLNSQMRQIHEEGMKKVFSVFSNTFSKLLLNYKKEVEHRKRLHDILVRLKGNIRVFCRIRPIVAGEEYEKNLINPDYFDPDQINVTSDNGSNKSFGLDKVFDEQATQSNIYEEISPVVTSCIDGKNVCIFAYGHTGSGKTFTMDGPDKNPGIVRRAITELFQSLKDQSETIESTISVSMIEVYNEKINDLLSPSANTLTLRLSELGRQQIRGLSSTEVVNVEQVEQIINMGRKNRIVSSTAANISSSRSHSITMVNVRIYNKISQITTIGKLNLIDLAGSERVSKSQVVGQQLKEAQCINKSLSELGNVVLALRTKATHVPFRNCLLTRLLEESLQGDSKTLMIVQITKNRKYLSEAVSSLTFADKISKVPVKQSPTRPKLLLPSHDGADNKKYKKSLSDITTDSDNSCMTDQS
uniref:Kinesin-like protein n=1 Tax=Rhabditophanes sp. KR3021 TaxID=114890 RepID=A0AC35U738_9BILA